MIYTFDLHWHRFQGQKLLFSAKFAYCKQKACRSCSNIALKHTPLRQPPVSEIEQQGGGQWRPGALAPASSRGPSEVRRRHIFRYFYLCMLVWRFWKVSTCFSKWYIAFQEAGQPLISKCPYRGSLPYATFGSGETLHEPKTFSYCNFWLILFFTAIFGPKIAQKSQ